MAGSAAIPCTLGLPRWAEAQGTTSAASGYRGGIATGNGTATQAGHAVIQEGGNAADAAAAALLVLSICDPAGRELHCFGGEVPILGFQPQKKYCRSARRAGSCAAVGDSKILCFDRWHSAEWQSSSSGAGTP